MKNEPRERAPQTMDPHRLHDVHRDALPHQAHKRLAKSIAVTGTVTASDGLWKRPRSRPIVEEARPSSTVASQTNRAAPGGRAKMA
jgi:hypothetical protein